MSALSSSSDLREGLSGKKRGDQLLSYCWFAKMLLEMVILLQGKATTGGRKQKDDATVLEKF